MTVTHHVWNDAYRIAPPYAGDAQRQTWVDPAELPTDGDRSWPPTSERGGKVLLVGEDNPQSSDLKYALWPIPSRGHPTCAGRNLQSKIMRVSHATYYGLWRTNLCNPVWDLGAARIRAMRLMHNPRPWTTIITLGRKVAGAFEYACEEAVPQWGWIVRWDEAQDSWLTIVGMPHPSGLSRAWNDPGSYDRALALLREVAPDVPWGELGRIPVGDQ